MKKILLLLAVTLASHITYASSYNQSIICSGGKGDAITTVRYHIFRGISVEYYLTSFEFARSQIFKNDSGGIEAYASEITRFAEGEKIIDRDVKLKIKFVRPLVSSVGTLLILEELSANGLTPSKNDVTILKCN